VRSSPKERESITPWKILAHIMTDRILAAIDEEYARLSL
jgi:hypothetical protein